MKKLFIVIACITSFSTFAQKDFVPDRPGQTETALTVEKDAFHIETGLNYNWAGSIFGDFNVITPSTMFRYGLTESLELRASGGYMFHTGYDYDSNGLQDFSVGIKSHLYSSDDTDLAFSAMMSLPTGSDGFSKEKLTFTGMLSVSRQTSENFTLGSSIGLHVFPSEYVSFIYAVSGGFGITENMSAFVEVYGQWHEFKYFNVHFDTGIAYYINSDVMFDLSVGRGLDNSLYMLNLGFSFRL